METEENLSKDGDIRPVQEIFVGIGKDYKVFSFGGGGGGFDDDQEYEKVYCVVLGPTDGPNLNESFDVQYILTSYNVILILKNKFYVARTRKLKDMKC